MTILLYSLILLIQVSLGIFICYLCVSFITGAPYVPTPMHRAKQMIELAGVSSKSILFDIGSGDGRLLMLAATKGASAVGIEINPYLALFSRVRAFFSPYRTRIRVRCANLWKTNLSGATVVSVYLLPWRMDELAVKLKRELKSGALVVTNSFIFPNWSIYRSDPDNHVYVYKIP